MDIFCLWLVHLFFWYFFIHYCDLIKDNAFLNLVWWVFHVNTELWGNIDLFILNSFTAFFIFSEEKFSAEHKVYFHCPYCCRKFVNRYNLKVHIRDKHEDNTIDLGCRICGKVMRNRSCLRVHLYHHRKQQLEAACTLPII